MPQELQPLSYEASPEQPVLQVSDECISIIAALQPIWRALVWQSFGALTACGLSVVSIPVMMEEHDNIALVFVVGGWMLCMAALSIVCIKDLIRHARFSHQMIHIELTSTFLQIENRAANAIGVKVLLSKIRWIGIRPSRDFFSENTLMTFHCDIDDTHTGYISMQLQARGKFDAKEMEMAILRHLLRYRPRRSLSNITGPYNLRHPSPKPGDVVYRQNS